MKRIPTLLAVAAMTATIWAQAITPVADKTQCAVADRQDSQVPDRVRLSGWVGRRVQANEANRLVKLDPDRLLEGYRKRPGRQSWDGEHIGKWLHAATLAWVYSGDDALRKKLDLVAVELVKCQEADGYLGTYLPKDRWTEWDVWAHKYNLLGLLTYMRYTGNLEPLPACRRMGDLLCQSFGDGPGKRDLIQAGYHAGMAPGSVLEPMVLLYRFTGETNYLNFAQYILKAFEQPNGAKIVSTLLTQKRVDKVGNGKAYEMLSCLNGMLEFYRATGDATLLAACQNAWQDIVKNRLYVTGAASYGELFHDDFDLPNIASVGETCVTVTWLQFNAQLLRLTGEARFADQLEHVVLNQLLGAQRPDGCAWGYYVQMEGTKPYSDSLDGHCCLSSGPRGVALIPTFATTTDADGVVVNLYDEGQARLALRDRTPVTVTVATRYPSEGRVRIAVAPATRKTFAVKLRIPAWCREASVRVNGESVAAKPGGDGYVAVTREWQAKDSLELNLKLEPRVLAGDHKNQGKAALFYGPLVLAADEALLGDIGGKIRDVALASVNPAALEITPEPAPDAFKTWPEAQVYRVNAAARRPTPKLKAGDPRPIRLVPFADAGARGNLYRVWLPLLAPLSANILAEGEESRSRAGNQIGSLNDESVTSIVVTWDQQPAPRDWYSVTLDAPMAMQRIVFMHGQSYHDGGWFDASGGKPKVQVKCSVEAEWETVGELADYPATTSTNDAKLQPGQAFTLRLARPVKALAVRVTGVPACGDDAKQAFSSCAELQAYAE
jgi:uncharacterized protein